jgi:hypothetical protein
MEAEWLPSNAAKGLVRDVTVQLAGEAARPGWKVIGPEAWASTTAQALALPLTVQLQASSGMCWESRYTAPARRQSTDRAGPPPGLGAGSGCDDHLRES